MVGMRTKPAELSCKFGLPKAPSTGGVGSGQAEPSSPQWVLGVLMPSLAMPARGESPKAAGAAL